MGAGIEEGLASLQVSCGNCRRRVLESTLTRAGSIRDGSEGVS
jgi:hypothetical protein